MANDNQITLEFLADVVQAARTFDTFFDRYGPELDKLAEGDNPNGRKLKIATDDARRELAALTSVIGNVDEETEALSAKEVGLDTSKAEDAIQRFQGALHSQLSTMDEATQAEARVAGAYGELAQRFEVAEQAIGTLSGAVERGSSRMQTAAVPARVKLDQLRDAVERTRASGGPVPPDWIVKLDLLEKEYAQAIVKAGQFRAAQRDVGDELQRSTIRAGELQGQVTTLTEAIALKFPAAEKYIIGAAVALGTFKVAFSQTREIVEGLKANLGIDIDAPIRQGFGQVFELYDKLIEKLFTTVTEEQRVANMTRVLDAAGVKHGDTVEEITKAYEGLETELRDVHVAVERLKDIDAAFVTSAAGVGLDDLKKRLEILLVVIGRFGGDFDALARSPLFDKFTGDLLEVGRVLDLFGDEFRRSLTGSDLTKFNNLVENFDNLIRGKLIGSVVAARLALKEFGVQTPEEVRKAADSLADFVDAIGGSGKATQEQAKRIHDEALKILASIASLPKGQRIAVEEISSELRRLVIEYGRTADGQRAFAEDGYAVMKAAAEKEAELLRRKAQELKDYAKGVTGAWNELLDLANQPLEPPEGPDRRAAEEELSSLQGKPLKSLEEVERQAELEEQLRGTAAAADAQGQANRRLAVSADEVTSATSRLREQLQAGGADFANLTKLQKEEIEVLFSRLQQTAQESGEVSVGAIQNTFARVTEILTAASLAASLTGKGFADVGTSVQGLAQSTGAAMPPVVALGQAATKTGEEVGASGGGYIQAAEAAKELHLAATRLAESQGEVRTETEGTTAGFITFRDQTRSIGKELDDAGDDFIAFGGTVEQSRDGITRIGGELIRIGDGAEEAGEGLTRTAEGVERTAAVAGQAGADLAGLGAAAQEAGEGARDGAAGVASLATAAGKAHAPTLKLAQDAELAGKGLAVMGEAATDIGEGVETAADNFEPLAKGSAEFAKQTETDLPKLAKYRAEVVRLKTELGLLVTAYDNLTEAVDRQREACEKLRECREKDLGE